MRHWKVPTKRLWTCSGINCRTTNNSRRTGRRTGKEKIKRNIRAEEETNIEIKSVATTTSTIGTGDIKTEEIRGTRESNKVDFYLSRGLF